MMAPSNRSVQMRRVIDFMMMICMVNKFGPLWMKKDHGFSMD